MDYVNGLKKAIGKVVHIEWHQEKLNAEDERTGQTAEAYHAVPNAIQPLFIKPKFFVFFFG